MVTADERIIDTQGLAVLANADWPRRHELELRGLLDADAIERGPRSRNSPSGRSIGSNSVEPGWNVGAASPWSGSLQRSLSGGSAPLRVPLQGHSGGVLVRPLPVE